MLILGAVKMYRIFRKAGTYLHLPLLMMNALLPLSESIDVIKKYDSSVMRTFKIL